MRTTTYHAIEPTGQEPAPLVPADLNMERCPWMKLDVTRFLSSRFSVECTSSPAFRAGFSLMLKSWHMTPAGSLPNDDRVLASLAGIGVGAWRRIKQQALLGFTLCSDRRLYCPFVCREAQEAAEELARSDERRDRDRHRKSGGIPDLTGQDTTEPESPPDPPPAGKRTAAGKRRVVVQAPARQEDEEAIRWRNRLANGPQGLWLPGWGPRPGEDGCLAPIGLVAASVWQGARQAAAG